MTFDELSSLCSSDWTSSLPKLTPNHPAKLWKYSAAPPKDILPVFSHGRDSWPLASLSLRSSTPCNDRALDSWQPPPLRPTAATPPENVRLTAKVTRSNVPTPRSLFRVAGSRTNNICRALILNPRERRRFDPRSPEPPVSLSTPRVHQQLSTYLPNNDFTLRHAVPRGIRRCRTLIAHGPCSVHGVRRLPKGGLERERGLIIISSGVPEHPRRCLTHVRTQPARRSRSWEQRDLFVRMIKKKEKETDKSHWNGNSTPNRSVSVCTSYQKRVAYQKDDEQISN